MTTSVDDNDDGDYDVFGSGGFSYLRGNDDE
jgi:hypothetical protein